MIEFMTRLFSSDFMPHGHCYLWKPSILWLHVLSDVFIAVSYFSIPIALLMIVRWRKDIGYHWIMLLFAAFICACGATHLLSVWTTWYGTYRIEGVVKAFTAVISFLTATLLWKSMPEILTIPTPEQHKREVKKREKAEKKLSTTEVWLQEVETKSAELEKALTRSKLLMHELDHRVKNSLNLVLSYTRLSMKGADSLSTFYTALEGRILTLSRMNQLLLESNWGNISIEEVVRSSLQLTALTDSERVKIRGDHVDLSSEMSQSLHVILHELYTNAHKYGALSVEDGGYLDLHWAYDRATSKITFYWIEHGGPVVVAPEEMGFGTRLINSVVHNDLKGSLQYEFKASGFECVFDWTI